MFAVYCKISYLCVIICYIYENRGTRHNKNKDRIPFQRNPNEGFAA